MKNTLITAFLSTCLISGAALASDDCTDPTVDWQPKERLRQMMLDNGWEVKRIKVDDGCYELKGRDRKGHRVEAKFSPASLRVIELEIKFDDSDDASDYLNLGNQAQPSSTSDLNSGSNTPTNKPKVTIE
ncbi:PepSY domain-containing protein [Amphritea sp. 2_MG-2023]|uniref:PepSY domain-containing protein n=1 Tax=Amphritea TaxID=515417 RepID=UPI001C0683BD|nr:MULTISPECIES: PepSY domain-containing protein [Amphritea]MBU2965778.1 PepSY domain-containing protein [Amphritea atlantica]MDO6417334.1 PepSY domain-containing protein [Amphritea sp. 2_MG-2023]